MIEYSTILKIVLYYVVFMIGLNMLRRKYTDKSIMIVLGSGGHTGELILMIKKLDLIKFNKIFFVYSHNDTSSANKIKENIDVEKHKQKIQYFQIYRSRNVGQSFKSSIITTIISFIHSAMIICKTRPNIIVTNGPGVALPLCYTGYILKILLLLSEFKILFIESYCRTKSISLTGRLIQPISDRFIVLWKELADKKREYIGKIL
jgi:beta-1,4-N-acetylglucosaminyltransferase